MLFKLLFIIQLSVRTIYILSKNKGAEKLPGNEVLLSDPNDPAVAARILETLHGPSWDPEKRVLIGVPGYQEAPRPRGIPKNVTFVGPKGQV